MEKMVDVDWFLRKFLSLEIDEAGEVDEERLRSGTCIDDLKLKLKG